jgi:LysM repeat protein
MRRRTALILFFLIAMMGLGGCFQPAGDDLEPTPVGGGSGATFQPVQADTNTPLPTFTPIIPNATVFPTATPSPTEPILRPVASPTPRATATEAATVTQAPTEEEQTTGGFPADCIYVVKKGEWLRQIARDLGVDYNALRSANPRIRPEPIYPGQKLNIPGCTPAGQEPAPDGEQGSAPAPTVHVVQPGDTLWSIAQRYGVPIATLARANNITDYGYIKIGQRLVIP